MSKLHAANPPAYRGPSKIPRFYQNSDALPPVDMNSGGQRHPSKLQQLQSNYQQRLLREKEEKLIRMYEDKQNRALQKVNSQQKMSMRDFFKERRQMEQNADNAHQLPSMNTHYKIKRMEGDMDDNWVNRQNSNGSMKYGRGAPARGRDKSNPLAPIDRNKGQGSIPVPMKPQRHGRPWTLKESSHQQQEARSPNGPSAPKSAPSHALHTDENYPAFGKATPSDDTPPPNLTSLKSLQKQKRHQHSPSKPSSGVSGISRKSDFQKWQAEQDEAREKRLAKAGIKPTYEYEESDEEGDVREGGGDDISKQQQELMARIQEQQRELERMRKEREREEIQERKEMERRKKREEERRRRLREEEEERLREEAERRIREEEEAELERKRLRAEQSVSSSRRGYNSASTNHRGENSTSTNHRGEYSPSHSRTTRNYSPEDDMMNYKIQPTPPPPQTKPVRVQRKAAARPAPPPREPSPTLPAPSNQDLSFFLAAANDPEAHADTRVNLVPCPNCGRKFASDRLQKHRSACGNITKKRKVHDPSKMRVAGTDMEKYYSTSKKQRTPPPKKSNWRAKHESFINAIRYAKKVTEVEKTGGNMSDLPPPPASDTSDYVQCPWCSRKFNPGTAERHIPRCKDIKSRPAPPKKR